MRVDISKIKTYYINPDQNEERKEQLLEELLKVGITKPVRVEGIVDKKPIGCAKSHAKALGRVARASLPALVLEDDAIVNPDYSGNFVVDVPDDADALYLGLTSSGIRDKNTITPSMLLASEKVSDGIYRIYNMLAAHAVVYFNKEYVQAIKSFATEASKEGVPQDTKRAKSMKDYNVYAVSVPMFIQSGTNRRLTKLNLDVYPFKVSLNHQHINL